MQRISTMLFMLAMAVIAMAQDVNVLPVMTPDGGNFEDSITVTCTFPEGCAGGKYWVNGGEIAARNYTGPIMVDRDTRLSIVGVNAKGKNITDVVTRDFCVTKVTAPWITTVPELGSSRTSFYVTKIRWNNALTASLDLADYKTGGKYAGKPVVWLVYEETGKTVATNNYNGLWDGGGDFNVFSAYLYKDYVQTAAGRYSLHVAGGVFIIDGKRVEEETVLDYCIAAESDVPVITPAGGTFENEVEVTISYPSTAFYKFYQIDNGTELDYTGPFVLKESATVSAFGLSVDFSSMTETTTVTFTKEEKPVQVVLPTPVISLTDNTVSITAEEGTVKYWFDDRMQTACLYTSPFEVSRNCRISAVAYNDKGQSNVADFMVDTFAEEPSDVMNQVLLTTYGLETVTMTGMSPNGRYVSGYIDSGGSPFGFVWDITSDKMHLISTLYNNQAMGVSNDGTVYGWRVKVDPVTGEANATSKDDLMWGYCRGGLWTAQPEGMTVNGITGDNRLYGRSGGKPAVYGIETNSMTIIADAKGEIVTASLSGEVYGGYIEKDGMKTPAYWDAEGNMTEIAVGEAAMVDLVSPSGVVMHVQPAYVDVYRNMAGWRYDAQSKTATEMRSAGNERHEWLNCVGDDGTMYGVYDTTLMSHESGNALVYTADGTWRHLSTILGEKGVNYGAYDLRSCKAVSADGKTMALTTFPSDKSTDDEYSRGMVIRIDAPASHLAPVDVKAEQMNGLEIIKVSWDAPLAGAEEVVGYDVVRNAEVIGSVEAAEKVFYDRTVKTGSGYRYAVVARYSDGEASEPSFEADVTVKVLSHMPVQQLAARQSGINDINLTWTAPQTVLPKLQYFDEKAQTFAFGTEGYSSEWGIRIPASDTEVYKGLQIRTLQFLPTGQQKSWTLNLYAGETSTSTYDKEPFYTQTLDASQVVIGEVNNIELDIPQELPEGKDLVVSVFIDATGYDAGNMLGISFEGFKSGYSDLCRVEGVHEQMVPISRNSSVATEVSLPIGVGVCTREMLDAGVITNYKVSDNGTLVSTTSDRRMKIETVAEGKHLYEVEAVYADGVSSVAAEVSVDLKNNLDALVAVEEIETQVGSDNSVVMTWQAPKNDDRRELAWGNKTAGEGLAVSETVPSFMAASVYPSAMTAPYADGYEITGMYYYPMADALFTLTLDEGVDGHDVHAVVEPEEPVVGQINYVKLDKPATIKQGRSYRLVIDAYDAAMGEAPLAFDTSDTARDGFSNLIFYEEGWSTLKDIVQVDTKPSWLMGLVIRQKDAGLMPVKEYLVFVDGAKAAQVGDVTYTTAPLSAGEHVLRVDTDYDSYGVVEGKPRTVTLVADGIVVEHVGEVTQQAYDMQGRRVVADKQGHGLFVIEGKKIIE